MIIYLDEDRAYLSWLARHRGGFVVEGLRKPTRKQAMLHRAACERIRKSKTRRSHWTTGRNLKACSLELDKLAAWAEQEYGRPPILCESCRPDSDDAKMGVEETAAAGEHLTKQESDIVDYVVEAAVIHLDHDPAEYDLTVDDVARYLDKTPAQLSAALVRLAERGYLRIEGSTPPHTPLPRRRHIYPTATSLKTLPAFEEMSDRQIKKELERLADEPN